jgi:hypothetical protein
MGSTHKLMLNNQIYKQSEHNNNMPKIFGMFIFAVLILTLLIGTVSASGISISQLTYNYKVNTQINIQNPCYYNGANCPPTTLCNLTVFDPDNSVIVDNQAMTYSITFFNYTLPGTNYSTGIYKCDMVCTYNSLSGSQRFYLNIGSGGNLTIFIILAIASFLVLIAGIYLQNEYIGFISSVLWIATGLYVLIFGLVDLENLYTQSLGWVSLGLGLVFLLSSAYSAISNGGFFKQDGAFEDALDSDSWGSP